MMKTRNGMVLVVGFLSIIPAMANGQDFAPPLPASAPPGYVQQGHAPQPGDPNTVPLPTTAPQQAYTQQQIDQLVAPIALYPDPLISQILMASTYPLEVVEEQRWLQNPENAHLTGAALHAAMNQQPWDPSVKSLVAFPQVVSMMDKNLQWTEQLGDAFLASQPAIMDSIQNLRQKAQAAGNLSSTPQQVVQQQQGEIVIQPANPQVIYVPYYNPTVVYGPWPWVGYPPYYFPPPPGYVVFNAGLFGFSVGFGIVEGLWGWDHWDWRRHEIIVDDHRFAELNRGRAVAFAGGAWAHDPDHRHGVPYRSPAVRQQFQAQATQARINSRGFANTITGVTSSVRPAAISRGVQPGVQAGPRSLTPQTHAAIQPQVHTNVAPVNASHANANSTQQYTQRSAPMFESFSHGPDVHTQAARGSASRATMPAPASHPAPQVQSHGGGENRGGNNGNDHR